MGHQARFAEESQQSRPAMSSSSICATIPLRSRYRPNCVFSAYRLTAPQQIDFHTEFGFGLTHRSPAYFFGLGYSVRFNSLF